MATRWDNLTLEERFWEKVDQQGATQEHVPGLGPCWEWTAACTKSGYGVLNRGDGRVIRAHRLSAQMHFGVTLSRNDAVIHRCDNPPCVNPDHLRVGRQSENVRDSVKKRRHKHGERGAAKLRADDVREIHDLLDRGSTHAAIAEEFGVSQSLIAMIATGRRWASVATTTERKAA